MGRAWGTPHGPPVAAPFITTLAPINPPITRRPPTVPAMVIRVQFRPFRFGRTTGVGLPCNGAGRGSYIAARTTARRRHPCPPSQAEEGNTKELTRGGVDGSGAHRPLHAVPLLQQNAAHPSRGGLARPVLAGHLHPV